MTSTEPQSPQINSVAQRVIAILSRGAASQGDLHLQMRCTCGDLIAAIEWLVERDDIFIGAQGHWEVCTPERRVMRALRQGARNESELLVLAGCGKVEAERVIAALLGGGDIRVCGTGDGRVFTAACQPLNKTPPVRFGNATTRNLQPRDLARMGTSRAVPQESVKLISMV